MKEKMGLQQKKQLITKLGQAVKIHKKLQGVIIKELPDNYFKVSTGNAGVNWVDTLHIDEIDIWTNSF